MKRIFFFNSYHNGDVHLGREFVKDIMNKLSPGYFVYEHANSYKLLKDIKNLNYSNLTLFPKDIGQVFPVKFLGEDIWINTWIGQENMHYVTTYGGCTFQAYYEMFKNIFKILNINYEEKSFYLPSVNYSKFDNIENIYNFMKDKKNNIYISNQNVNSGQVHNFSFDQIIDWLSLNFKNVNFFITNKTNYLEQLKRNNIFFNSDIININENDLNENSYISTFCDIIVGRSSGPYCYAQTKENYLNENKKFICFDNTLTNAFWLLDEDNFAKAKRFGYNFVNENNVLEILKNHILETF